MAKREPKTRAVNGTTKDATWSAVEYPGSHRHINRGQSQRGCRGTGADLPCCICSIVGRGSMAGSGDSASFRRAGHALDAANFFLADVRDGLGPYLAIYLLTEQKWDEASIGLVMSLATIAGIVAQTPAGALVDATRAKRLVMIAAAIMVTTASLLLPLMSSFWPVAISQSIAHAAGVIFAPAIAAVSLGIFGARAFIARIGRNETFNHAGNAVGAVIAGAAAYAL